MGGLVQNAELGMYVPDGMLLANEDAELATEPDAMFISNATIETKRVSFTAGEKRGAVATRVVGSPDLVIEIVSPSSQIVDTEWLMSRYHEAGVNEYWLIDARGEGDPAFTIYRRAAKEFVAVRKVKCWSKSTVFGKSFRLVRTEKFGMTNFALEVK